MPNKDAGKGLEFMGFELSEPGFKGLRRFKGFTFQLILQIL